MIKLEDSNILNMIAKRENNKNWWYSSEYKYDGSHCNNPVKFTCHICNQYIDDLTNNFNYDLFDDLIDQHGWQHLKDFKLKLFI